MLDRQDTCVPLMEDMEHQVLSIDNNNDFTLLILKCFYNYFIKKMAKGLMQPKQVKAAVK